MSSSECLQDPGHAEVSQRRCRKGRCTSVSRVILCCSALLFAVLTDEAGATTRYYVRLNTNERVGQQARMALDLTSGSNTADSLEILDFAHDGKAGPIVSAGSNTFEGGPVRGHLLAGVNPAPRTVIGNDFFYNQLGVPFDSLGASVTFAIQLPEPTSAPSGMPDEMAFFYLADSVTAAFPTTDPLGANSLFAIDVTGQSGGELSVFAPMQFVPPDTLRMINSTTEVPASEQLKDRLRFRSVSPNPSLRDVRLVYDVPEPGGLLQIRVFDVAGRLVAVPFSGARTAGTWATRWDGNKARGRPVPTGVYIVQLQMAGQSLVRRVVLTR